MFDNGTVQQNICVSLVLTLCEPISYLLFHLHRGENIICNNHCHQRDPLRGLLAPNK